MAQKELALYVAEQLAPLGDIRYIPMMGGWLFYYKDKLIGGIYGDGFAVKDTESARKFMPDCRDEVWENTPTALLPCTILEDREKLCEMVKAMLRILSSQQAAGNCGSSEDEFYRGQRKRESQRGGRRI